MNLSEIKTNHRPAHSTTHVDHKPSLKAKTEAERFLSKPFTAKCLNTGIDGISFSVDGIDISTLQNKLANALGIPLGKLKHIPYEYLPRNVSSSKKSLSLIALNQLCVRYQYFIAGSSKTKFTLKQIIKQGKTPHIIVEILGYRLREPDVFNAILKLMSEEKAILRYFHCKRDNVYDTERGKTVAKIKVFKRFAKGKLSFRKKFARFKFRSIWISGSCSKGFPTMLTVNVYRVPWHCE